MGTAARAPSLPSLQAIETGASIRRRQGEPLHHDPGDAAPAGRRLSSWASPYFAHFETSAKAGDLFTIQVEAIPTGYSDSTVAISEAVPEPATWAMMMLGFAGLGFAGYRRVRATASIA